jgi:tetratricopeptide (TPR) repeat protein
MDTSTLETAVSHIQQACAQVVRSPFFFVVGAGISCPSVPLASEVESRCRKIAAEYGRSQESRSDRPVDRYSHWFDMALPQPAQRQEFLRNLIDRKPITLPNFQLAHLLIAGRVASLVVTPNFDDFISRALTLFGKPHISCDQPYGVDRIDPESDQVQIVHVHGTYKFYDCANLTAEIRNAARRPSDRLFSMASLLDNILYRRSPIVVGYSGWEGDAIMTALERRLKEAVGYNVYWFCYRTSEIDAAPEWLRNHPNVRFVVPPNAELRAPVDPDSTQPSGRTREGQGDVPTLAAHQVFGALIRRFGLQTPELILDPLAFLARQLEDSLPKGEEAASRAFLDYSLQGALDRVRQAIKLLSEQGVGPLAKIRDAMGRQQYHEAILLVEMETLSRFGDADLAELIGKMYSAGKGLNDNSNWEERAYDAAIKAAGEMERRGSAGSIPAEQFGWALFGKAYLLASREEYEPANALLDEVVRRYGNSTEAALHVRVAFSLYEKAVNLGNAQAWPQAVSVCDEIVQRFQGAVEPELTEPVALAMAHKADALRALTDREGAVRVCDELIARYQAAPELPVQQVVAYVMVNRGSFLASLGDLPRALEAYDQAVSRYEADADPGIQHEVARSLLNKAMKLRPSDPDRAARVCDEVKRRYASSSDQVLANFVRQAQAIYDSIRTPDQTGPNLKTAATA